MLKIFSDINKFLKYLLFIFTLLLFLLSILKISSSYNKKTINNKQQIDNLINEYLSTKLLNFTEFIKHNHLMIKNLSSFNKILQNQSFSVEIINNKGELIYWYNINESLGHVFIEKQQQNKKFANIQNKVYHFTLKEETIKGLEIKKQGIKED